MNVLAVIHGPLVRAGVFGDEIEARHHRLSEWNPVSRSAPPEADAVIVFGGGMHVDQHDSHPWLHDEDAYLRRLLEARTPVFGVCLGAQLLAKAADAWVGRGSDFEIGWHRVELTKAGVDDPVLGRLPQAFDSFQWHHYAFDVPVGAEELARTPVCPQAFRLGDSAWGVQFHPEVTLPQVGAWVSEKDEVPVDGEALLRETQARIAAWNDLGRTLCGAFLEAAER